MFISSDKKKKSVVALGPTVASYTPPSHSDVQFTHTSPRPSGGNKDWGLLKEGQPWRNTPVTFEHGAKAIEPRHCLPPCCLATSHPRCDCVYMCARARASTRARAVCCERNLHESDGSA